MLTSQNLRKVTLSVYVHEDEADIIEQELLTLYSSGSAAMLAGIEVEVEKVVETESASESIATLVDYFREMQEESF